MCPLEKLSKLRDSRYTASVSPFWSNPTLDPISTNPTPNEPRIAKKCRIRSLCLYKLQSVASYINNGKATPPTSLPCALGNSEFGDSRSYQTLFMQRHIVPRRHFMLQPGLQTRSSTNTELLWNNVPMRHHLWPQRQVQRRILTLMLLIR